MAAEDYLGWLDPVYVDYPWKPLESDIEDSIEEWLVTSFPHGTVYRQFSGFSGLRFDLVFATSKHFIVIELKRIPAGRTALEQCLRYWEAVRHIDVEHAHVILAAPAFRFTYPNPERTPWLGLLPLRITWPQRDVL